MTPPEHKCEPCRRLAVSLTDQGLRHWLRQDTAFLHFIATPAAVHAYQLARQEELAALNDRFDDITAAGHVPWLDLKRMGRSSCQAPHGVIPKDLPGPVA